MKNIRLFSSSKYMKDDYKQVSEGVYQLRNTFYMSLSFEQEPEFEEGNDSSYISQYPLEDLLDKYSIYVSDFYEELNQKAQKDCYIELSSDKQESLEKLKDIIGKHVYNKVEIKNGEEVVNLIIE